MIDEYDVKILIRQSACKLFHRHTFIKTTVSEIAREAGIGKGTIYNYYRTKEEIVSDIFNSEITDIHARESEKLSHRNYSEEEKILYFSNLLVDVIFDVKAMLFGSFDNVNGKIIHDVLSLYNHHKDRVIKILCNMINSDIRSRISEKELFTKVKDYHDLIHGRITLYTLESDWEDRVPIKEKLQNFSYKLFKAIVYN